MKERRRKLSKSQLYQFFLESLGDNVLAHSDLSFVPLLIDLKPPYPLKLRVYLFNCTNPHGGRSLDEYKIQIILPGQKRGHRSSLDYSDNRMPILAAYVRFGDEDKNGIFVLWDSYKHDDFSYSANMQVKSETIIKAFSSTFSVGKRGNNEIVIASRAKHLLEAIKHRITILQQDIMDAAHES